MANKPRIFRKKSLRRLHIIKHQHQIEGAMTLRRIYYVLVGKGLIKPGANSYNAIKGLCKDAREQGYLDWKVIVDRARRIEKRQTFENFDEIFKTACHSYRRDSMQDQKDYIEVWIEKDAVSKNILRVTYDLDVSLVVGRGFSSITFIHDASQRCLAKAEKDIKMLILYISDLDPEGEHIPELVKKKFVQYGCDRDSFDIDKIALTLEHVKKFNLPSNVEFKIGAKQREKRYVQDFLKKYGEVQYEIDALSSLELNKILADELKKVMDFEIPKRSDGESEEEVREWIDKHYKS